MVRTTMTEEFECNVTAGILDSGRALTNAAHAGAIVGGIGVTLAHSPATRILFAVVIVCWLIECWLAVRVAIDASVFRTLAAESEGGRRLDALLTRWALRKNLNERSIAERSRAAIRLWRLQIGGLGVELVVLMIGVIVEALRF